MPSPGTSTASLRKRAVQWATIEGKQRLMVAGRINRFIPNPTFDPVARPGVLDDYFRGKPAGDDIRAAFGELEPIRPEYRDRDARLAVMDEQGMQGCFLFPTLGVGMEEALVHDPEAAHATFTAFNRWMEDDWGYAYQDRIFAAPYVCLLDPAQAEVEVARVLEHGARCVVVRSGPVKDPLGPRSLGDPAHDRRVAAARRRRRRGGVPLRRVGLRLPARGLGPRRRVRGLPLRRLPPAHHRAPPDLRHHRLARSATASSAGSRRCGWPPSSRGATGCRCWPRACASRSSSAPTPSRASTRCSRSATTCGCRRTTRTTSARVAEVLGVERVLFGSDWPHAEGLADPSSFVDDLAGFTDAEIQQIMRDNGMALVS